jgi:hypothetical protein
MAQERTKDLQTVRVTGSETLFRPDGLAAIRLDTLELGPIAFEVNQHAIDTLRKHLMAAEQFLRQPTGKH